MSDFNKLYEALVRLNYIDKDGFVTDEFNGDVKWLDEDKYKRLFPEIISVLYEYI